MAAQRRVAIVHNHPIHYKHLLFTELKRQRLSFEVLFTAARSSDRMETPPLDPELYHARVGFPGPYERAPRWGTARFIWRSLEEIQPAVVIISGYYDAAAWTAWVWAALRRRARILWAESNVFDYPRRFYKELPKRLFAAGCDLAHVYGTSSKAYLASLGVPEHRIITKRAVVDVRPFLDAPSGDQPKPTHKVLVYVGRFSAEKNLPCLMRAFAALSQDSAAPRMVLALVGYGPLEQELRKLAADLGAGDLVQFWGPASQEELPRLYRRADVFILPSVRDTWGLVVLEAMLSGLPVLVSERCGCAQDLVSPETGWTFSPFDQLRLTQLLDEVSRNPRLVLESMGRRAAALASTYSPENCARIVIDSVNNALDGRSAIGWELR
jgi:1,2-diacylglycerol 3-alpha-glucosyltransferase